MMTRRFSGGRTVVGLVCLLVVPAACAQEQGEPDTAEIPRQVMDGLTARFPRAAIDKWTMEEEGEIVVYDIEFNQDGLKFEADIREDGSIFNWERAIGIEDLPGTVKEAADERYPGGSMTEIMAITEVTAEGEALEGYEIVLEAADAKEVEIMVTPDGEILEDTGTTPDPDRAEG